jgi:hypothetical protein
MDASKKEILDSKEVYVQENFETFIASHLKIRMHEVCI